MSEFKEIEKVCNLLNELSNDIEDIPERGLPQNYIDGWQDALETAIDKVKSIPTTDVRPERHGEWRFIDNGFYECSECGAFNDRVAGQIYCWKCGAKMDGKDVTK